MMNFPTSLDDFRKYTRSEWQDFVNTAFAVLQLGFEDTKHLADDVLKAGAQMGIVPEEDALKQSIETFNSLVEMDIISAPKFGATE